MTTNAFALSVRQPWAELILLCRKTVEIRTWETKHRGRIWLHAGRHMDAKLDHRFGLDNLSRGAFVGFVDLVSIEPLDAVRWEQWRARHLDPGDYRPGFFGWNLDAPCRLRTPLPAPGSLGLFAVPAETLERLQESPVEEDLQ
jgi:ASCH domain-containing protein